MLHKGNLQEELYNLSSHSYELKIANIFNTAPSKQYHYQYLVDELLLQDLTSNKTEC